MVVSLNSRLESNKEEEEGDLNIAYCIGVPRMASKLCLAPAEEAREMVITVEVITCSVCDQIRLESSFLQSRLIRSQGEIERHARELQ